MEVSSAGQTSSNLQSSTKSVDNVKLESGTSAIKSSQEIQKLALKLIKSSGINIDTKA